MITAVWINNRMTISLENVKPSSLFALDTDIIQLSKEIKVILQNKYCFIFISVMVLLYFRIKKQSKKLHKLEVYCKGY